MRARASAGSPASAQSVSKTSASAAAIAGERTSHAHLLDVRRARASRSSGCRRTPRCRRRRSTSRAGCRRSARVKSRRRTSSLPRERAPSVAASVLGESRRRRASRTRTPRAAARSSASMTGASGCRGAPLDIELGEIDRALAAARSSAATRRQLRECRRDRASSRSAPSRRARRPARRAPSPLPRALLRGARGARASP